MARFENNWQNKPLEILENSVWSEPINESYLITTCHKLRKKPIREFEIEDLRIMIGQSFGLKYLIPIAIDKLKQNILAEGHFYEGDLLKAVLTSEPNYWKENLDNWKLIIELFNNNLVVLNNADTSKSIRRGWFDAFTEFERYNK